MSLNVFAWFKDVGQYFRIVNMKGLRPLLGKGIDYTAPEYAKPMADIVTRFHPKRMHLRLKATIEETTDTSTLRFERVDGSLPPFRPGQYVNLFIEIDGVKTSRPFSISSRPGCGYLDLTVQRKPGGFVSGYILDTLKVGDELRSTGPVGHFYHEPLIDGAELVFLAGGSGVTPFMSIIRDQAAKGWPLKIQLLFGSRNPEVVIFGAELAKLAAGSDRFTYDLVISEPPDGYDGLTGFLDAELIKSQVADLSEKTFYICGPVAMYDPCLAALEELEIRAHRIRREIYGPPDDITKEPGWPEDVADDAEFEVEVEGKGTIKAAAREPLLNSLERGGLVVPAVCRSGECSVCRTRILSGKVFMPPDTGVRESDLEYGYVHPCVCYPLENLQIRF